MSVKLQNLQPPVLAGFGNPLLDICVQLKNESIYEKFNLESDGQKEISASELKSISNYLKNEKYNFQYCAGGCAQNTLRSFQWIVKLPYYSVMFGGVGNDEQGTLLKDQVNHDGVITRYSDTKDHVTGTCIAMINGVERSLVAHLGAANIYSVSDVNKTENIEMFKTIQVVYIEGFFIIHSFEAAKEVVKLCKLNGIVITFNICGVYLFKDNYKEMLYMLQVADIIIGNSNEYREFWKCYDEGKTKLDIEDIITHMQNEIITSLSFDKDRQVLKLPIFCTDSIGRIVLCTQGSNSVLCVYGHKELLKVEPEGIAHNYIKDTTGAGDSFAGGFLAGILQNHTVFESIKLGCWVAGQIIQQIGCSIPTSDK